MEGDRNDWDSYIPTVDNCRFVTTEEGTAVYGRDGRYLGLYETDDAAVEIIRSQMRDENGGYADEI